MSDSREAQLYRAVDEILHYEWDPIGVCDIPEARDEYSSYVPPTFSLLVQGEPAEKIAEYLEFVEVERMGMTANRKGCLAVANQLVRWREAVDAGTARQPSTNPFSRRRGNLQ